MAWAEVGTATFGPFDDEVVVGPAEVPPSGLLPVRLRLLSGPHPFQFGYCLLFYRSAFGRELGTIRVWPGNETDTYMLGTGSPALDPSGVLVLQPRAWNLRWIQAGFSLTVQLLADLAGVVLPADRFTSPGFESTAGTVQVTRSGDLGRLTFTP